MRPRTKLHHQVIALKEKLPSITERHAQWAYRRLFRRYAWNTKHKVSCFECGHSWDYKMTNVAKLFPVICPQCKKKLEARDNRRWRFSEISYFQIITVVNGFQVIRVIQIYQHCAKGYPVHYSFHEIYQHWISMDGRLTILAVGANYMGFNYNGHSNWHWCSPMEIRGENDRYFINDVVAYPRPKVHPMIIRNGFSGNLLGYNSTYLFQILLAHPMAETLMKAGQYRFLEYFDRSMHKLAQFWPQIKICIRNSYIVSDTITWFDYLNMLVRFKKDIFNPKYICPEDLKKEHDFYNHKIQVIRDRELREAKRKRIEELKKTALEYNKKYIEMKGRYLDLSFTDGIINIVVLKDVDDFQEEGKTLHHCVFNNEYFIKEDSLILSARKKDKRLETIEVDLPSMKVIQCMGAFHKNTRYHKKILSLLNNNLPAIKKISRKRKQIA